MNTAEIKKDFHNLIDSIDNENLLISFYDLMKARKDTKEGQLWNQLSKQEQDELFLALEESEHYNNLISQEDMKKKHKKWLYDCMDTKD